MKKNALIISSIIFVVLIAVSTFTCGPDEHTSGLAANITWIKSTHAYGHTAVRIVMEDLIIYLDPVALVNATDLQKADIILVTHDHDDHFSKEMISRLSTEETIIITNEHTAAKLDFPNIVVLLPGENTEKSGITIEGIESYNSSHPKELKNIGFLLSSDKGRIFCSGDTAFNGVQDKLMGLDVAVLNIRNPYSMTGKDAVAFAEQQKPKFIIPIHWMPDNNIYNDEAEIKYIKKNIPNKVELIIKELE